MKKFDIELLEELEKLRELVATFPFNSGEQFINIELSLHDLRSGTFSFGLKYKNYMGEQSFYSLKEATELVKEIIARGNPIRESDD